MKHSIGALLGMAAAVALAAGGYQVGLRNGKVERGSDTSYGTTAPAPQKAGEIDPKTGKKVLYWHDPMSPGQKFDRPGKSPFMDMMLVPVYEEAGAAENGINVSPRMQQSLGVRTVDVVRGSLPMTVQAVGSIAYNERDQAVIQARAMGYVERLRIRATLDRVGAGAALAELYVPDWVAAQEEFLAVRRLRGSDMAELVDAARARMRQAGMNADQVRLVESSGQLQPRMSVTAPIGGLVSEINIREGMTVTPGMTLFRINGLATVWANAEIPESQSGFVQPGGAVEGRSQALPGTVLTGRVQAILPQVAATTRTMTARVELPNPASRLVPGMFVTLVFSRPSSADTLLVPSEAVIQTGKRAIVMLAEADGKFRTVEVETGTESNGQTEIRRGLEAGEKVVASAQFLLDSEASLRSLQSRTLAPGAPSSPTSRLPEHRGTGKIESVTKTGITLSHGPIASLQWEPMTMEFALSRPELAAGLRPGESVSFSFEIPLDGPARLTRIEREVRTSAAKP